MNNRDTLTAMMESASNLAALAVWIDHPTPPDNRSPFQRNEDARNGHPRAAAWDNTGNMASDTDDLPEGHPDKGWRPNISDPTASAALRPDKAKQSRDRVESILKNIRGQVMSLAAELGSMSWAEPKPASDFDRRQVDRENIAPEPGCESCARVNGSWRGVVQNTTTQAGVKYAVCSSCRDWVRDFGELPPLMFIESLNNGTKALSLRIRNTEKQKMDKAG